MSLHISFVSNHDFGNMVYEGQKYLWGQWDNICDIRSVLENPESIPGIQNKNETKQKPGKLGT